MAEIEILKSENVFKHREYFLCGCIVDFNKDRSVGRAVKICKEDEDNDR